MPNQLAASKRRQSLAEHAAVLAALDVIARREKTTVMALLREAAREAVRKRATQPARARELQEVVWRLAPRMPRQFKTAAQLARFKRSQREFDQVVLDLQLVAPADVQARNSIVAPGQRVQLLSFDRAHASASV
jgi:hypothetical protein